MTAEDPPSPVSIPDCPGSADLLTEGSNNKSDPRKTTLAEDNRVPAETEGFKTRIDNDATAVNEDEDVSKEDQTLVEKQDVTSPKKKHFEKALIDRIGVAIAKAIAAGSSAVDGSRMTLDERGAPKYIKAKFASSGWYIVPWAACFSWEVVEVLLKQWFCESEQCLLDIANGDLSVSNDEGDFIHPRTWETVVRHNSAVRFWPHSEFSDDSSDDSTDETDKEAEKNYESRIQYVVKYYEKDSVDDMGFFMASKIYKKPVEFEVTDDNGKLPALEEIKTITSSRYKDSDEKGDDPDEKKAKLGPHDRVTDTSLRINSPYLLNVLRSVVEYKTSSTDGKSDDLGSGLFHHPYKTLYYHLPDLLKYKSGAMELRNRHTETFNQKYDEHFDLLCRYLLSQAGIAAEECKARSERRIPVVTFATYWLLLKPGSQVYVREYDGSRNAYIINTVTGGISEVDGSNTNKNYKVEVWNLAFDGSSIQPCTRMIEISVFDNEREIASLDVFPARFIDDHDNGELEEKLVQRGERYFTHSKGPAFLQYSGKGLKSGAKTYKRARVVVEHVTRPWHGNGLIRDHFTPTDDKVEVQDCTRVPRCECKDCRMSLDSQEVYAKEPFSDYYDIIPSETKALSRLHYKIMASHMYAFILKDREYDILDVAGLEQPSMAETAIDNLVMEAGNKDLIKAIARIYTDGDQSTRFSADFIHGKGEGQIILLHGPPGTGKTLTAESVAEYTKRPLLSITAADLGHEPEPLEQSLLRYFKRASDWDAIVLLDEADVYLEQRTTHDLKRNSIVSVFLRALDYFQGILFLTTNRVGHFDEAFMSRIHLSLGYEPLNNEARGKIWGNLFQKLKDDHKRGGPLIQYEYDAKQFVKSAEVQALEWNGREIRNAFQTAVALSVFDAKHKNDGEPPEVTENHLRQVVSMSSAFRKYMKATHSGMDSSSWAHKHGNREDNFPSTPAKQGT